MILLLLACSGPGPHPTPAPPPPVDPTVSSYHRVAEREAAARVTDPARGGPPVDSRANPLPPFLGVDRRSATYVGTEACGGCHPAERSVWQDSAHAHAIDTLVAHQAAYNPDCLRCHVTGMGHPGGYVNAASQALAQVGCESCHGPGSDHIQHRTPGYGDLPLAASACVACHTEDNSPDFRFEIYWPKVAHGGQP